MIYMFFLATCINEQSPGACAGRFFVKRRWPLVLFFQLLYVGCLFHVHFIAFLVIEMIFKI